MLANKVTFHNILVIMRPRTKNSDLSSLFEVSTHLHNEFVKWMEGLKKEISVKLVLGKKD